MTDKTTEQLADEALGEIETDRFIKFLRSDPLHVRILEIMAPMGWEKGERGPTEFSIVMGKACYELGQEDMKKELAEKLNKS